MMNNGNEEGKEDVREKRVMRIWEEKDRKIAPLSSRYVPN
jgi:hypothetical protein